MPQNQTTDIEERNRKSIAKGLHDIESGLSIYLTATSLACLCYGVLIIWLLLDPITVLSILSFGIVYWILVAGSWLLIALVVAAAFNTVKGLQVLDSVDTSPQISLLVKSSRVLLYVMAVVMITYQACVWYFTQFDTIRTVLLAAFVLLLALHFFTMIRTVTHIGELYYNKRIVKSAAFSLKLLAIFIAFVVLVLVGKPYLPFIMRIIMMLGVMVYFVCLTFNYMRLFANSRNLLLRI